MPWYTATALITLAFAILFLSIAGVIELMDRADKRRKKDG